MVVLPLGKTECETLTLTAHLSCGSGAQEVHSLWTSISVSGCQHRSIHCEEGMHRTANVGCMAGVQDTQLKDYGLMGKEHPVDTRIYKEDQVKLDLRNPHHIWVKHEYKYLGNGTSERQGKPTKVLKHTKATEWYTRNRLRIEKQRWD